jgi:hypothetical protein
MHIDMHVLMYESMLTCGLQRLQSCCLPLCVAGTLADKSLVKWASQNTQRSMVEIGLRCTDPGPGEREGIDMACALLRSLADAMLTDAHVAVVSTLTLVSDRGVTLEPNVGVAHPAVTSLRLYPTHEHALSIEYREVCV